MKLINAGLHSSFQRCYFMAFPFLSATAFIGRTLALESDLYQSAEFPRVQQWVGDAGGHDGVMETESTGWLTACSRCQQRCTERTSRHNGTDLFRRHGCIQRRVRNRFSPFVECDNAVNLSTTPAWIMTPARYTNIDTTLHGRRGSSCTTPLV